ncbi:MAG: cytidine deaminase [Acholeplasmataceae bacterium]|jgi:cytidine deaminase|nr:cytidine deaminase [Acholeplasmataceae bacterium]
MKQGIKEALKARENAYAPYSNFKVGAAILMKDGKYIYGANIENASFGLSNCAERSALFSALSQGYKKEDIKEFFVIANSKTAISPCGACRQVINELVPKEVKITLSNLDATAIKETNSTELLPFAFEDF